MRAVPHTPNQSDPYSSRVLFGRLWRGYLADHKGTMALALIFMMIEGSTLAILSYMLEPLFDRVFVGGETQAIWWVGGVIFVLFLIRAATFVINRSLMTSVSLSVSGGAPQ